MKRIKYEEVKDLDTDIVESFEYEAHRNGAACVEAYFKDDNARDNLRVVGAPVKAVYVGCIKPLGQKLEKPVLQTFGNHALIYLENGEVVESWPISMMLTTDPAIGIQFRKHQRLGTGKLKDTLV